jgi:serine/threonine protein kinase
MNEKEILPDEKNNIRIRNMLASIERTFLPVESTIGKYRIVEEIDRGGMAVVYKAIQLDLDRVVALKVMPANISINRGFVERFLTEAHAVAKLNHQYIVKIYEVATEKNIYYLSMEYIPGKNLYYYLHYHKPKLVDVLEIIVHLTEALSYSHAQKIIHRDLKLNNVIMRDPLSPVLIDFGLAKALENDETVRPGITRTGEIMGSPSYMAPERLLGGPVDHRSDICSLGIMLYEMLTFKNPYLDQRNLHQTTMNVMESNPIPPRRLVPWLPLEIEAITLKAMAKEPANRYQTMEEFKADIVRYQHGDPVLARPPSIITKVRHFVKRHWAPLVIGIIILIFSGLFVGTFYIQSKKEESHWRDIYSDSFNYKADIKNWLFFNDTSSDSNSVWLIDSGDIRGTTTGKIYALLNKHFNRDILIECDINANSRDLYNAGIFLSGDQPDSAYCFFVNKDGAGNHGMTLNGSKTLLKDSWSSMIPFTRSNHVVIERIQDLITFSINGTVVSKVYDNLPVLGRSHDKIGVFITNGSARFDNFKIYRRAIPEVPSPTLIADRFRERGDYEAALDEYHGLLADFTTSEIVKEIKVKMVECLVRLKKYDEASSIIKSCSLMVSRDEELNPRLHFLQATMFTDNFQNFEADSVYKKVAEIYPSSNTNQAISNSIALRCVENLNRNRTDLAQKDVSLFVNRYMKNSNKTGLLFEELLDYYFKKRSIDSAIVLAQNIIDKYSRNGTAVIAARIKLGYLYLHKGKKDQAKEVFDQIITGNATSDRLWEALNGMAEISTYDFLYQESGMLYKKIFYEGPQASPVTWMAGVALAIEMQKDSMSSSKKLFSLIAEGNQPFPVPRMIARYYLEEISDSIFKKQWSTLLPNNSWYFYYFAQKAQGSGNDSLAKSYLYELKDKLTKREWNYFKVIKILNNYSRW